MAKWIAVACILALSASPAAAQQAWESVADGFITDASHPTRPGDVRTYQVRVRVALDEQTGEAEILITDKAHPERPPDRYYWRRGRVFQSDETGGDLPAGNEADISPAALAVIHPALVATLIRERPENLARTAAPPGGSETAPRHAIANSDVLWQASTAEPSHGELGLIRELTRRVHHDVLGTFSETVLYDDRTVTITHGDRPVARLEYAAPNPIEKVRTPKGEPKRDCVMVIPPEEFVFKDFGGGLFACELTRANSRVFVIEFSDHLLVFEGLYTTRNVETLSSAIRARFKKPVRCFAFSHIHGQYIAGVRAWAHEGAILLAPPSSEKLIDDVLAAPFDARPDAWSHAPGPSKIETVADRWSHEDASMSVVIINNKESTHTDEYFLVYLPRTKTLLTGDLLSYRPGKPLSGRSVTLARYIEKLGLEVDRCLTTWPLEWPGIKNDVTGQELRGALPPETP
jgi:hypothetical protein